MLTLLKGLSRFEWFAIAGVLALALAVLYVMEKYDTLLGTAAVSDYREQQAQVNLTEEKRSAAISDTVVLEYSFDRDVKLSEAQRLRYDNTTNYFRVRDAQPVKETSYVPQSTDVVQPKLANPPQPTQIAPPVAPGPSPAAIAALASGLQHSYCAAYPTGSACTP